MPTTVNLIHTMIPQEWIEVLLWAYTMLYSCVTLMLFEHIRLAATVSHYPIFLLPFVIYFFTIDDIIVPFLNFVLNRCKYCGQLTYNSEAIETWYTREQKPDLDCQESWYAYKQFARRPKKWIIPQLPKDLQNLIQEYAAWPKEYKAFCGSYAHFKYIKN